MLDQSTLDSRDPQALAGSCWTLKLAGGTTIAPHLVLLPDGRIGGSNHRSETSWNRQDASLQFLDGEGLPSALFHLDEPGPGETGWQFHGTSRSYGAVILWRLPEPAQMRVRGFGGGRRRNLVLLRAGPDSLHSAWTQDIADADRNWDLCLSWYGDPAARLAGCDHFFAARGTKFQGLANILGAESVPWDYDYVWMPDDDLMASWADINLMFALCAEYDLMLAQPSLDKDSYINHPITCQDPTTLMRFTTFVEIMAPVFSRAALRLCASTFSESDSGYGLDHVWPRLICAPSKIAIIDAVSVIHTRPVGATYNAAKAIAEGNAIEDAYGVIRRYQILGSVSLTPVGIIRLRDPITGQPIILTGEAARRVCA